MATNPDVYLLYEYRKKNAFTVRMKITLDEAVDEALLTQAASEAMTRFPYYSVKVDLDEGENYVLLPNDRQIKVCRRKMSAWCLDPKRWRSICLPLPGGTTASGSTGRTACAARMERCTGSKRPCIST